MYIIRFNLSAVFLVQQMGIPQCFLTMSAFVSLQVPVHVFLDFSTLDCRHLSESVELFVLDLMKASANYTNREVKVR